jgi:hypothetical protein
MKLELIIVIAVWLVGWAGVGGAKPAKVERLVLFGFCEREAKWETIITGDFICVQ